MIQLENSQQVEEAINKNDAVLIYFSGENCSVCKVLKPKLCLIIIT